MRHGSMTNKKHFSTNKVIYNLQGPLKFASLFFNKLFIVRINCTIINHFQNEWP
jgi:hypothetical protein